jgi:RimJ/RimL family protein N-acetyltransferase
MSKNSNSGPTNNSSRIYIAELDDSHLTQVMTWKNDVQLARQIVSSEKPVTLEEVSDWFIRTINDPQQALFGIFLSINQACIGIARLMFIDKVHRTAEVGIYIGAADMRSHGFGREAVMQLLRYSFCDLKLERLYLRVLADNEAARRCYQACGFAEEGVWREHVCVNGKRHNMLLMGLLRREFRCEAD